MDTWFWWLIVTALFTLGEMFTLGLVLAPFAIGAAVATLLSVVGLGIAVTLIVFLGVSGVCLFALRPLARSHRMLPPAVRTGTAALVGTTGRVVERIANDEDTGSVKINGEIWTARTYEEGGVIEAGTRVSILEIRGATVLVSE